MLIFERGAAILKILNEEIDDIMKAIKYLENYGLLIKSVSETIQNEAYQQRGTLDACLFGN